MRMTGKQQHPVGLAPAAAFGSPGCTVGLSIHLEVGDDGWVMGHLLCTPGATMKAPTPAQLLDRLPVRWADEVCRLKQQGLDHLADANSAETTLSTRTAAPRVVEAVRTKAQCGVSDTEAFFAPWAEPLQPQELEWGLRYLEASRTELRRMVASSQNAPAAGARVERPPTSLAVTLHHLADAELFYLVRLLPRAADAELAWHEHARLSLDPLARLDYIRSRLCGHLRALDAAGRARITVHHPNAERWSARKVLYRAIWHERHHVA